jgi:hypothetical protein
VGSFGFPSDQIPSHCFTTKISMSGKGNPVITLPSVGIGARRYFSRTEKWVAYWTEGKGIGATSAEEDTGYLEALTLLAHAKRVDFDRVMDLRTASDYEVPSQVKTPCSSSPARRLARFPALRSPWNRLTWSAAAW